MGRRRRRWWSCSRRVSAIRRCRCPIIWVGWFGGFLPAIAFAIVAATGNLYAGLWYPVSVSAVGFVITLLVLPETYRRDIS